MKDAITALFLLAGSLVMLLAGLGLLRLPDLFLRMQAATKASILGLGLVLLAVIVHFSSGVIAARAALVLAFIFLTGPVSAHVLARAAYFVGVPLWEGTRFDELRDRYDVVDHTLRGSGPPRPRLVRPGGGPPAPG
ncbi:MAG: monovalent cation/H(+) antiporter subunit G [Anaerolineae bacterium]|nr:monovalent cation/H(+) antiporter subunit G [Anaerolineae bacterium]